MAGQMCKAVLLRRDHLGDTIVEIPYPPAPVYYQPRERASGAFGEEPDLSKPRPADRRFVLDRSLRSKDAQWMEIYNEGRSQTPKDGFVYKEEPGQ